MLFFLFIVFVEQIGPFFDVVEDRDYFLLGSAAFYDLLGIDPVPAEPPEHHLEACEDNGLEPDEHGDQIHSEERRQHSHRRTGRHFV